MAASYRVRVAYDRPSLPATYAVQPTPCGEATAPVCGGVCPAGQRCLPAFAEIVIFVVVNGQVSQPPSPGARRNRSASASKPSAAAWLRRWARMLQRRSLHDRRAGMLRRSLQSVDEPCDCTDDLSAYGCCSIVFDDEPQTIEYPPLIAACCQHPQRSGRRLGDHADRLHVERRRRLLRRRGRAALCGGTCEGSECAVTGCCTCDDCESPTCPSAPLPTPSSDAPPPASCRASASRIRRASTTVSAARREPAQLTDPAEAPAVFSRGTVCRDRPAHRRRGRGVGAQPLGLALIGAVRRRARRAACESSRAILPAVPDARWRAREATRSGSSAV